MERSYKKAGILFILFYSICMSSCRNELPGEIEHAYKNLPEELDFNVHVRPILSDKCFVCHGPDKAKQKAGLQLDLPEMAYGILPQSPGKRAIVPGNLAKSEVFHRILTQNSEKVMPKPESNLSLTDYEKAVLVKWIEDGAKYLPHWAFVKPEPVVLPDVINLSWVNNPIDRFILRKLEVSNLGPSEKANKEVILRRLSFDLTGLPPTPHEIATFLADDSKDAYERQVDRLIASPHYAEKMAIDWMDLSRFADTHGYSMDEYRDVSPWRDWVIKAFNENLPYDEFIIWQLAGDLLPQPTRDQLVATTFNRLHPQNMEGGIIGEEFRTEYVIDRTSTVGQAFMALSVGCARCHDHKYDPISQKEFYELSSFFNNVNEAGQISYDNSMPVPTILLTTEKQEEVLEYLREKMGKKLSHLDMIAEEEENRFQKWIDQKQYHSIVLSKYPKGIQAHFQLEDTRLINSVHPDQQGIMSDKAIPNIVQGKSGKGLLLDGDSWLDCGIGTFKRSDPFTIGINVKIPSRIKEGVIFHKGIGAALYNFKGFHVGLKNNQIEIMMAHTAPDNAIIQLGPDLPRKEWLHLALSYDGSSSANGLKVYLNGEQVEMNLLIDNLYKDIHFNVRNITKKEPGIQVGARMRGAGIGGAVVDDIMIFNRELSRPEIWMICDQQKLKSLLSKSRGEFSDEEISMLKTYYLFNYSASHMGSTRDLQKIRASHNEELESIHELMVMKEMESPRQSYILERGSYDAYLEAVFPGTPKNILEMPDGFPRNRLGLANWFLHEDHPLTARVAVNRYWQNYFGKGLVKTTGDFGNQGSMPSHPELLDWLALEFRNSGWDVKALQKLIVMSATYQQSSRASDTLRETDPDNILLAYGPSGRLSGELIRDNALAASGLMNYKIGGESVKPYQPDGLWKVNNANYEADSGDKLYRRSLYTFWKRSVPHPTLATFDAPDRSECLVKRQRTNTPLQALVLLNDPIFIECSRVLGEMITRADDARNGVTDVFLRLTGRNPSFRELEILMDLQKDQLNAFIEFPSKAKGWLTTGEKQTDPQLDQLQVAANAVVASTIMNADATITKR